VKRGEALSSVRSVDIIANPGGVFPPLLCVLGKLCPPSCATTLKSTPFSLNHSTQLSLSFTNFSVSLSLLFLSSPDEAVKTAPADAIVSL
jgi:hypothetical protein